MPAQAPFVGGPLAGTHTVHVVRCLDADGVPVQRGNPRADNFAVLYHRFREGPTDDAPIRYIWGAVLDARFRLRNDEPR